MTSRGRFGRDAILAYGLLAYASFHACFLYLILFLNDALVPVTLDSGPPRPLGIALALDAALVGLFALQHTVMARGSFKRTWTRIVPAPIERSSYVFATVAVLAVLMWAWAPIPGALWHVEASAPRVALWVLQGAGWLTLVASTFLMDHWGLFGVRQVLAHHRGVPLPEKEFRTPLLYRFVRHPMMVGLLVAFWATPDMTASRLVFAALFSAYVWVGIRIEERDLVATLGDDYRRYQQRVPRLLPGVPGLRRRPAGDASHPGAL
jgi:protein-S-isoprenylcysteine O-methyltransferase Ste14